MNVHKPHIYFRADASKDIGYGHFVRTLALADMVGDGFEKTFATRYPTSHQIEQIEVVCDNYIALGDDHFGVFLSVLHAGDIVVLDNYFFDTQYQRKIKAAGCKLVCIDDMHDKHYVADVVINHGLTNAQLFSIEPYTLLCLGLDWALLRQPFLQAQPRAVRERGHCAVSFGGVDAYNLTAKVASILSAKPDIKKITAIVGDAYAHLDSLSKLNKVEVRKNLSAQQMADLFCTVQFAVLPTSTVCIEAIACECPILGGYYVDNQKEYYTELVSHQIIVGIGNLANKIDINAISLPTPSKVSYNKNCYNELFSSIVSTNFQCDKYQFVNYTDIAADTQKLIYNARNHPDVRCWMTNTEPFDFDSHIKFVKSLSVTKDKLYWAVFKKDDYIGSVYLNPYSPTDKTGEWGIFLAPQYIGAGIGLAIEFVFMTYLFDILELKEIFAQIKVDNDETYRLQQKFGFDLVCQNQQYYKLVCTKEKWAKQPKTLKEFKLKIFAI